MAKKVRYTQPLLGKVNAAGYLGLVPGASVLVRQNGVACTVYASNAGAAMTNPVPTGVPTGTAGVDVNGTLLVYLDPGSGYDGLATVGAAVSTFPIPDISPDVSDVSTPSAVTAELEKAFGTTTDHAVYVSKGSKANDANDGLSMGRAVSTLAAALNLAAAYTGQVRIVLGAGTWTEKFIPSNSDIILEGIGGLASKVKLPNAANDDTIRLQNLSNCIIRDIAIDGNKANQTVPGFGTVQGINFAGATNCRAERVIAYNCQGDGFYFGGIYSGATLTGTESVDCHVIDCTALDPGRSGGSSTGAISCTFVRLRILRAGLHGIDFEPSSSSTTAFWVVRDNHGLQCHAIDCADAGFKHNNDTESSFTFSKAEGCNYGFWDISTGGNNTMSFNTACYNRYGGFQVETTDIGAVVSDNFSYGNGLTRPVIVVNKALTSNVATLTTRTAHGYVVGDPVAVSKVGAPFDGAYTVTTVPTATTFTYAKVNANVAPAVATGGVSKVLQITGFGLSVQSLAKRVTVARNRIWGNAGHGLAGNTDQMVIRDNQIFGNGKGGVNVDGMLLIGPGIYLLEGGNQLYDDGTGSQLRGIENSGGADIRGTVPTFSGMVVNVSGPTNFSSLTKTLAAVPVGTSQTQIAHGLSYTPSKVVVKVKANATVWESQAADNSYVFLTSSAAATPVDIYLA